MMLVAGARSANCRSEAGLQDQLSPIIVSMIPQQTILPVAGSDRTQPPAL
jgi:hypothetical protein